LTRTHVHIKFHRHLLWFARTDVAKAVPGEQLMRSFNSAVYQLPSKRPSSIKSYERGL